jgi:hypothetical protein
MDFVYLIIKEQVIDMKNKRKGNVSTRPEFITTLDDGRRVSIVGNGKMIFRCDCCDKNHLSWVEIESVLVIDPKDEKESVLSEKELEPIRDEVETLIETHLYDHNV